MIKKKPSPIVMLCIILFIISFQCIPVVKSLTESYTDPQNDIYRVDFLNDKIEIVSSHDELDIVSIALDGQYTNTTFAGNITGNQIELNIYFFEQYNQNNLIFEYAVHYSNFTGTGFKVVFVKYNSTGENYSYEFWNETIGWTSINSSADSIGTFSDYTIEATINSSALQVHENITWFAVSTYLEGNYGYLDCAPNSYCPLETNEIPGYEFFALIGAIVGISAILIYKTKKSK